MENSFTDEQLLNLVNNTILSKTEFELSEFTGGGVQITSTYNHKVIKHKIYLTFGYDSKRNSKSYSQDIDEELSIIWQTAILLKVKSIQVSKVGSSFSELNSLMSSNFKIEDRDNKIEDRDRARNNIVPKSLRKKSKIDFDETIINKATKDLTEKDFTLSKECYLSEVPDAYLETLERYITNYADELILQINLINGDLSKVMTYEDFYLSAFNYRKSKYINFAMVYRQWRRNNVRR